MKRVAIGVVVVALAGVAFWFWYSLRLESKAGKNVLVVLIQPRPFTKHGLVLEALDLGVVRVETAKPPPP